MFIFALKNQVEPEEDMCVKSTEQNWKMENEDLDRKRI